MSEEEKYLLNFLYRLIEQGTHKLIDENFCDIKVCDVINLIEKQQKEIERLEKDLDKNFVYKYDIEEIINKHCPEVAIGKLEELLEKII